MTPDLQKELAEVVRLSGLATPGTVELWTSCSWRRIIADGDRRFLVPGVDHDGHPNMDSTENAEFVVALVNLFRTHHATIQQNAEDAAELAEICATLPSVYYMDPPDGGSPSLADQFKRMAADALRLRALEQAVGESPLSDFAYRRTVERADEILREKENAK